MHSLLRSHPQARWSCCSSLVSSRAFVVAFHRRARSLDAASSTFAGKAQAIVDGTHGRIDPLRGCDVRPGQRQQRRGLLVLGNHGGDREPEPPHSPDSSSEVSTPPALPRFADLDLHPKLREALQRRRASHESGLAITRSTVRLDSRQTEIQHQVWKVASGAADAAIVPQASGDPCAASDSSRRGRVMDVIGRAHTGTGKTLAYLLPSLDRLYRERDEEEERQRQNGRPLPKRGVRMLVLSPTRELARQIYREALHLGLVTQRNDENRSKQGSLPNTDADSEEFAHATHGTDRDSGATSHSADFGPGKEMASGAAPLVCQVIHGGVPKRADVLGFRTSIPDVLISTPGRLLDHLKNTHVSSSKDDKDDDKNENDGRPFSSWLQSVRVLVVDEVDRLLDMGFREDINTIVERLPSSESRQTLLLSATLPSEVRKLMLQHVHPTIHVVVDCTQDFLGGTTATWDDGSYEPPATAADTIDQTYAVLPTQRVVSGVVELILHLQKSVGTQGRNKVLVFFPTTSQVIFYSCLLNHHLGRHAWEMHSEMSQMRRMVVSDAFRDAPFGGVMLTSDVSARGVDYPGVTHVVQVGVSRDRETYLHRIGRTGRAGKHGKGILLVLEPERDCLVRDLSGLSIRRDARLQRLLDHPPSRRLRSDLLQISHSLRTGNADDLMESAEACYRSLLSYYYSRLGVNKRNEHARIDAAVDIANSFAHQSGMADLPTLPVKLATQCGLLNHPRLNIDQRWTLGSRFDVGAGMISSACDVGEGDFNVTASAESAELWSQEQHVD